MIFYVHIGMEINVFLVQVIIMLKMENALKYKNNANFGTKMEIVKDVSSVIKLIKMENVLPNLLSSQNLNDYLLSLIIYS